MTNLLLIFSLFNAFNIDVIINYYIAHIHVVTREVIIYTVYMDFTITHGIEFFINRTNHVCTVG